VLDGDFRLSGTSDLAVSKENKKITFTSFKFFSKKNPDVADDLSHK
jgi:hypothetical protein